MKPLLYPVRSRVKLAIIEALANIRREAGFNTDVKHVYTRRDVVMRADDPPELFVAFGPTVSVDEMTVNTNNTVYFDMGFRVWYISKSITDVDLECDMLESDILKALLTCTVTENKGGREYPVRMRFVESQSIYDNETRNDAVGFVEMNAVYWHKRDDPFLWDDGDSHVVIP